MKCFRWWVTTTLHFAIDLYGPCVSRLRWEGRRYCVCLFAFLAVDQRACLVFVARPGAVRELHLDQADLRQLQHRRRRSS